MKPPAEYDGNRKDFLSWHESFTSMLSCRSANWKKIIAFIVRLKEKRIKNIEHMKTLMLQEDDLDGVREYLEEYRKQLYRHLMDYTKDDLKVKLMTGGVDETFETYRATVHKGLNVSDDRILQVEARVLHPREAKDEKDIHKAMQEWRYDKRWLLEAGRPDVNKNLDPYAKTILIAMMPDDGPRSMRRYMREIQSNEKFKDYTDFEEEMWTELARRDK